MDYYDSPEVSPLEVYTVNISEDNKKCIFGGSNDTVEIICIETNEVIFYDVFPDSIFYANFIEDGLLVVSYNGDVVFYNQEYKRIREHFLNTEISCISFFNNIILLGTEDGQITIINNKEILFNKYIYEIILHIEANETHFFVLTNYFLLIYDFNLTEVKRHPIENGNAFLLSNNVICVSQEKKVSIFTLNKKIKEFDMENVKNINYFNGFILSGEFNFLYFINLNYEIKKVYLAIQNGITILKVKNSILYFADALGIFYYGHFNNLFEIHTCVGGILDFSIGTEFVVFGGLRGLAVEKLYVEF